MPATHEDVLADVLALLADVDPYGFTDRVEGPLEPDEYEAEAYGVLAEVLRLADVDSDALEAVWRRWFRRSLSQSIGPEAVGRVAARLAEHPAATRGHERRPRPVLV